MPKTPWADRYRAAPTNKSNVMRTIILEGPISRAALAKRVGLSLPSVMTITENLINRGLVRAVGKGKSSGGKPPELLSVVPESEYYMGVDIGRGTIRLVLMNLAQKVVYGTMVETGEVQPVEAFVDRLCERIQSSLLESGVALDRLAGVGVAMPGLIERDTGHILFSPDFGWSDIPLQSWLQSRLSYPVLVENANRALALAESGWRGDGGESGTHTVLCVNIGLEGPISRAALAKRVGLSLPSVMTITENLINRGLVRAVGKGKSSGGKPPELLSVVPESEYYMGVDIGRGTIRLVLMNLAQKVVYGTMVETGEVQPVEAFVDRLCERIQSSLLESGVALDRLAGVGVAMPGLIERDTGHILFSPDFGWSDIPLQSWLQSRLSYPVLVENANRALALAESGWRGDGGESGTHTVLCVNIGHGIGAALMQNNQLYYGSSGTSGELGHITVCKDGPLCACGNSGCLEAVASGEAIALQARDAVCSGLPTSLRERCGGASERIDAKLVFEAAAKGDAVALSIVDKATDYIGIGLAMAINILDPDCIVLCGGLTRNGPLFFDRVAHSMQMRQMRQAGRHVTLRLGTRGDYGTAIGAAHIISYNGWRVPRLEHYY